MVQGENFTVLQNEIKLILRSSVFPREAHIFDTLRFRFVNLGLQALES
jgi:hypothetical protein